MTKLSADSSEAFRLSVFISIIKQVYVKPSEGSLVLGNIEQYFHTLEAGRKDLVRNEILSSKLAPAESKTCI